MRIENSRIITVILYSLVIFFICLKRKDRNFVKINFLNSYFVFLIENTLLSLPLIIIMIFPFTFKAINNLNFYLDDFNQKS